MRYWLTTSPAGCVQVRLMVVGSGEELLKSVGEDGIITAEQRSHDNSAIELHVSYHCN